MTQSSPYRLPPNVRPTAYRLTLTPDLENFTFTGQVSIDLQVFEDTGRVLLNAAELEITSASITDAYGGPMPASGILLDEKRERAYLTFPREIATGRATLSMEFSGILNDQLRGFYRCRYTDADGADRNMAATQFEATDARRAFPCWDEPAAKATFELTLRIPSDLTAVSNTMPEAETPAKEGTKEILFAPTPKMSTYLLAFIVGDLAAVEERAPNGTLVRIWATRGKEEQGPLRPRNRRRPTDLSGLLLRHSLPPREAGPPRPAGLCRRRNGELGGYYVPGDCPTVRPGQLRRQHPPAHCRNHCS